MSVGWPNGAAPPTSLDLEVGVGFGSCWFVSVPASRVTGRRGVAQPGSAPEWGSGGRWFESSRPDQISKPWVADWVASRQSQPRKRRVPEAAHNHVASSLGRDLACQVRTPRSRVRSSERGCAAPLCYRLPVSPPTEVSRRLTTPATAARGPRNRRSPPPLAPSTASPRSRASSGRSRTFSAVTTSRPTTAR